MSDVPIWLLDVDGVLNVDTSRSWHVELRGDRVWLEPAKRFYTIKYVEPVISFIREVHALSSVEVRWCTTWCVDPTGLEELWQFPTLERAPIAGLNGWPATVAKVQAALNVIKSGRRLIWTDDSVVPKFRQEIEEVAAPGQCLLIGPNEVYGLTPEHIVEIEEFIAKGDVTGA